MTTLRIVDYKNYFSAEDQDNESLEIEQRAYTRLDGRNLEKPLRGINLISNWSSETSNFRDSLTHCQIRRFLDFRQDLIYQNITKSLRKL